MPSAEIEAQCCTAEQACRAAEGGLRAAKAALEAAPRDAQKRAVAREEVLMAEEELEGANATLATLRAHAKAAQRREDEAEAKALGEKVERLAQMREVDVIAAAFDELVVKGVMAFFADLTDRRLRFMGEASKLNKVWGRLGHHHRVPGVDIESHTGTESIPPAVSVSTLTTYSAKVRGQLQERIRSRDPVERAAAMFLQAAFDHDQQTHLVMREVEGLVHERHRQNKAGGAVK